MGRKPVFAKARFQRKRLHDNVLMASTSISRGWP